MSPISWVWFWYVLIGFVMGAVAVYLWHYAKTKSIHFKWYEWILIGLSFILFMFGGQTVIGSIGEGESRAAWMTAIFVGVPLIVLAVITYRSVHRRVAATV